MPHSTWIRQGIESAWKKKICQQIQIQKWTLKHTLISRLLNKGVDEEIETSQTRSKIYASRIRLQIFPTTVIPQTIFDTSIGRGGI